MKTSQQTKILNLLDDNQWHCTSQFYSMFIADPRKRLHELREQGKQLEWRWCKTHNFHSGQQKEWRLIPSFSLIQEIINSMQNATTNQI
jgi:queuine/archaeosine tRNA-ribosyltransferase